MLENSLKIFKALSDHSRILIVNALMEKEMYVEELVERLDLSPSTASFHLKKLEESGLIYSRKEQYYTVYSLEKSYPEKKLKELIYVEDIKKEAQEERLEKYRQKVISTFFENGKLKTIPVQRKKRRIILEELAKHFEKGRSYAEKEVNIIIADFNDDFCSLRRDMIAEKLFERENGFYKVPEYDS